MKSLYNCTAWYDRCGLVSYNTRVVTIDTFIDENGKVIQPITLYNYRSNTTLSHIRKYIRLLNEECKYELARKVQMLYDYAKEHKNKQFIYMTARGDIQ